MECYKKEIKNVVNVRLSSKIVQIIDHVKQSHNLRK